MVEKSKLDEDKEGKTVDPSHYREFADAEIIAGCQDIYAVAHSWVVCSFWEIGDRLGQLYTNWQVPVVHEFADLSTTRIGRPGNGYLRKR
ncbi:hypothetical protein Tco_1515702 [Tanacetum coccineum]